MIVHTEKERMNKTNQKSNQNIREPDGSASHVQTNVPDRRKEKNAFEAEPETDRAAGVTREQIREESGLQTAGEMANHRELHALNLTAPRTTDQTGSKPKDRIKPKTREGSPTIKPCANIEVLETAKDKSPSEIIPVADNAKQQITLPAVPLYLIAPVLSREIHTHKGVISEVFIRRAGQHRYKITLVTSPDTNPGPEEGAADAQ